MSELKFKPDEMEKLASIAWQQRERILERVLAVFPVENKGAEAAGFVLAILAASSFTSYPEQQHDQAQAFNQVFARWREHSIGWRLTPMSRLNDTAAG